MISCVLAKESSREDQRRRDHLPSWRPLPGTGRERVSSEDGQRLHFAQRLHHEEQSLRQRHLVSTLVSQISPHFH
jgi:hypothetical protein